MPEIPLARELVDLILGHLCYDNPPPSFPLVSCYPITGNVQLGLCCSTQLRNKTCSSPLARDQGCTYVDCLTVCSKESRLIDVQWYMDDWNAKSPDEIHQSSISLLNAALFNFLNLFGEVETLYLRDVDPLGFPHALVRYRYAHSPSLRSSVRKEGQKISSDFSVKKLINDTYFWFDVYTGPSVDLLIPSEAVKMLQHLVVDESIIISREMLQVAGPNLTYLRIVINHSLSTLADHELIDDPSQYGIVACGPSLSHLHVTMRIAVQGARADPHCSNEPPRYFDTLYRVIEASPYTLPRLTVVFECHSIHMTQFNWTALDALLASRLALGNVTIVLELEDADSRKTTEMKEMVHWNWMPFTRDKVLFGLKSQAMPYLK